jgi:hypothetical protein
VANFVLKILEDYLAWEKLKQQKNYDRLSQETKDELRLENDNDAKYYYEILGSTKEKALCADTIISFWTPYSRLLDIEARWKTYKTSTKSLESLINQIKTNRKNKYTEVIKQINSNIEEFAKICYTKGNYMLLPKRQMNNQRYSVTEDRIDLTLYECFEKGALAKFFRNENELKDWIDEQDLSSVFVSGDKCKEKINWFVIEDKPKCITEMKADEIYEYLKKAIILIQERNKQ